MSLKHKLTISQSDWERAEVQLWIDTFTRLRAAVIDKTAGSPAEKTNFCARQADDAVTEFRQRK